MKVEHSIQVNYESTNDYKIARQWLDSLPNTFAADFETAIRYSKEEVEEAKRVVEDINYPKKQRISAQAVAKATALGHPSHCTITHCSVAWTPSDAYVFIIDSQEMADVVLEFLTTTDRKQIWHNYGYDGRFIRYFELCDAKNVEDTQILAKTLINHVEVYKANSGLKELAGSWYGDWGISSEYFDISQQYEEKVLKYAAIDACATYKLWIYLNEFIDNNQGGFDDV